MKISNNANYAENIFTEEVLPPIHRHPLPPHLREQMLLIDFDEDDLRIFTKVYGNEEAALAAMNIIMDAPPEMKILAIQTLTQIKEI